MEKTVYETRRVFEARIENWINEIHLFEFRNESIAGDPRRLDDKAGNSSGKYGLLA